MIMLADVVGLVPARDALVAVDLATPVHEVGVIDERGDEGLGVAP